MRNLIDAIWPTDGSINKILDLGCGDLWFTCNLPGVTSHIGIDIHQPSIDKAYAKNANGFKAYCMDIREFVRTQPADYFDAVLAIDAVEHFPEDDAMFLISEMLRTCKKLVVVWTTLGYIEQGEYDNNGEFNPYQKHLSAPTVEWFPKTEGWKVDTYPDWHGPRGGAIFAYNFMNKKPAIQIMPELPHLPPIG